MLVINDLTKMYSGNPANNSISFTVEKGEIFGLLGPNGSGKTTLISQIIGFLKPTKGHIEVSGTDVISAPDMARKLCSLQPQENISLNGLTPRQAIELTGRIRNGNKREIKEKTDELLKDLQLEEWADQQTEKLSGGIKRLVTFCMAIVVPGKLVILDEPTNDVDPIRRKLLWEQVRKVANSGATVLLITHNVLEAERSVDRLALIDNGKLVGVGTPASLKGAFNKKIRLELT
ncbi:ABC transporter ATP-binding protein, partial [Oceanobacillus sp. SE10311]